MPKSTEKIGREARAEMEQAKARSESTNTGKGAHPAHYKIYDRIKDNVSLRTIDIFIFVVIALLVIALIYGIATRTPPQ